MEKFMIKKAKPVLSALFSPLFFDFGCLFA